jgi:hypothetical protein
MRGQGEVLIVPAKLGLESGWALTSSDPVKRIKGGARHSAGCVTEHHGAAEVVHPALRAMPAVDGLLIPRYHKRDLDPVRIEFLGGQVGNVSATEAFAVRPIAQTDLALKRGEGADPTLGVDLNRAKAGVLECNQQARSVPGEMAPRHSPGAYARSFDGFG